MALIAEKEASRTKGLKEAGIVMIGCKLDPNAGGVEWTPDIEVRGRN